MANLQTPAQMGPPPLPPALLRPPLLAAAAMAPPSLVPAPIGPTPVTRPRAPLAAPMAPTPVARRPVLLAGLPPAVPAPVLALPPAIPAPPAVVAPPPPVAPAPPPPAAPAPSRRRKLAPISNAEREIRRYQGSLTAWTKEATETLTADLPFKVLYSLSHIHYIILTTLLHLQYDFLFQKVVRGILRDQKPDFRMQTLAVFALQVYCTPPPFSDFLGSYHLIHFSGSQ